jgi:hypothetical protein
VLSFAKLPQPQEVSQQVQLLNTEREANRLWSISPIDMTKAELAEQRKERDRMRKMIARRKAHAETAPKGQQQNTQCRDVSPAPLQRIAYGLLGL